MEKTTTQNDSFTLLRTYYEAFEKMNDEAKLQFIGAVMAYGFDGVEPTLTDPMADLAFTLIRPTLENSVQYHATKRECGAMGGRPKKQNPEEKNQTETKEKPNENQTETKTKPNDNQTETEKKRESDSDSDSEGEGDRDCDNENENDHHSESFAAGAEKTAPGAQDLREEKVSLSDFERLWRAYPNKGSRQDALREYFNTDLPSSRLIPMIRAQRELYEKKKDLIVPNLATWLERGMYVHKTCILANRSIQKAGA